MACARTGPPSPEVTGAICRVPSTPFSQAPWYTLPVHLCRFRVRSWRGLFPGSPQPAPQSDKGERVPAFVTSGRLGNINPIPIGYGFRPRLRGPAHPARINLAQEPLDFRRECFSHSLIATHVSILTSDTSSTPRGAPSSAYGTLRYPCILPQEDASRSFGAWLEPRYIFGAGRLIRPVSYYAFFKGWLLLSQPPGCLGRPTSFPT